MKKIELLIFIVFIIFAILIKEINMVNTGSFATLFMFSLSIFYLAIGWKFFRNEASKIKSLLFSIPMSVLNMLLTILVLFKLQHWWSQINILATLLLTCYLILIVVASIKMFNTKILGDKNYFKYVLGRNLISIFVVCVFTYLP